MDAEAMSAALAPGSLGPPIAKQLGLAEDAVVAALSLLAVGAQPAFVALYRPEHCKGLSVHDLERIQAAAAKAAAFEFRRQDVKMELERKGEISEAISEHLRRATAAVDLDDLHSSGKKRKKGGDRRPGAKARAAGLAPLAELLWTHGSKGPFAKQASEEFDLAAAAEPLKCEEFPEIDNVVEGARMICAEDMTEYAPLKGRLRRVLLSKGKLKTAVVAAKKDKANRYSKYFDRADPCKAVPAMSALAIGRGEREGLLTVDIEVDDELVRTAINNELGIDPESAIGKELLAAAASAWAHGLGKSVRSGVRKLLKERADRDAIGEYCAALRPLLLAPALGAKPVIAIDPGQEQGCRVIVIDAAGQRVAEETVYPLQPKLQVPQTKARIAELCQQNEVAAIVIVGGTAGREVERLCRSLCRETEELKAIKVASVDGDAASLYASSRQAKEEIKGDAAGVRRALSAGRRVQNPLRELIKVDPRKLGLGPHQNEVDAEELRGAIEQVISSCVSEVAVELNDAPADLLARVPGLSTAAAKAVVAHRDKEGPFRSRAGLLDVPGLAGKAFEQCAGFLRIRDGEQPLDATMIHPERYGQVTQMARDLGVTVADLLGNKELLDKIERNKYLGEPAVSGELLGESSLDHLLAELRDPGRDVRPEFTTVEFSPDIATFEDLKVGMDLPGIVMHLAGFGAFVDVGISQEGLVHVSELTHAYISSPTEAVYVGQTVTGRVIEISPDRKRFSLSLKALMPRPQRPPQKKGDGKPRRGKKGKGGPDGKRDKRRGDRDGPKKKPDRVLEFRMDLSELAERLK